ncbi:hypothetical protein CAPTEDRAFT_205043 [Capitella teleta]|uniref:Uncharacterized protein n=1 Tax=Capitella teleta TaxID=283909 RepID=R7T987_CAPTE|nr:hypothetical protein CAPTEDRAFT_205043 [Capitella teleta]|eukprot:ELT90264.1 hypothetical protein CAPTEDRAFT_205043 [Capitella teleta]
MGRQIRNTLPTLPENLKHSWPTDDIVCRCDEERKVKSSDYYDKRHGVVPLPELKSGQRVFVPDRKESGVVIGANETPRFVMVQVGKGVIRRNRYDLRILPTALNITVSAEDSSESPVPATSLQSSVPCAVFSHTSEGVPDNVSPRTSRHVPTRFAPVACLLRLLYLEYTPNVVALLDHLPIYRHLVSVSLLTYHNLRLRLHTGESNQSDKVTNTAAWMLGTELPLLTKRYGNTQSHTVPAKAAQQSPRSPSKRRYLSAPNQSHRHCARLYCVLTLFTTIQIDQKPPQEIIIIQNIANNCRCERFNELEYEPTRKQAFEPHLPTRKGRPPPWQKQLDGPPANCVIAPGYILARGKSRVSMVIDPNQFFKGAPQDKLQKENQDHDLIAELSQQIDDLTLHLEEEKLNHKETKRKAADILRDKLEDANNRHSENVSYYYALSSLLPSKCSEARPVVLKSNEQVRILRAWLTTHPWLGTTHEYFQGISYVLQTQLKEQHAEEMENTRKAHREEIEVHKRDSEATLKKVQGELDFLQGAFESYKSHVAQEMQEKWKLREEEISIQHRKTQDAHLKQMRSKFTAERNQERSDESKQHRQHLSDLKKDHTKDLEKLERRYKDTADLQKNFSKMQSELETTKDALSSLQVDYDSTCLQLASTTRQLTDTKIKLVSLEEQFQDRVAAVDNSYLQKIHGLMSQNTELRRLYMKKCGELYDEKSITDVNRDQKLESAKDAMKFSCVGDDAADHELLFWMEIFRRIQNDLEVVINTRKNADISIAAVDTDIDQCPRNAKDRPASAPGTRHEVTAAQLSAADGGGHRHYVLSENSEYATAHEAKNLGTAL